MASRIEFVFGPYLRSEGTETFLTQDGRKLETGSAGMALATELIDCNPAFYADEIIRIMKPFCRPFDIEAARSKISGLSGITGPSARKRKAASLARRKGGGQLSA
ncbi:MAG: hypothetical protein ACK5PT_15075 [Cereibacter sp.]|jgi:hypothetical protein|nr:hypothetical protein [Rhodobacter sp.]